MGDKENEPEEIISLEAVREFLMKHNGKVRQPELLNNFRHQLSSPTTKVRARQEFKDMLQLITAVKTENGEKYIVLTKQQTEHFQSSVITRKANRPLSVRKELAKSKIDFARAHDGSDDEDGIPNHYGSDSTLASQDSGVASETSSHQSVSTLRSALSNKIIPSQSMDSINTYMAEGEDDDLEDDIGLNDDSVVLPEEKEWMLAAAHGRIDALKKLLEKNPELAKKKDFVMTALHWAAKLGRLDIVKFIGSAGGDFHSKSGYTPLHIAAMSGKDHVILQLIELYGANIHARDHSGKKPKDVVRDTVGADVQGKLGRSLVLDPNTVIEFTGKLAPPRRSFSHSASSDGDASTPEIARRHLKSVGASAKRSMSFLKKKKKHEHRLRPEDIQHSPQIERREEQAENAPSKRESFKKVRPKSQVVFNSNNSSETIGKTTMSFEI